MPYPSDMLAHGIDIRRHKRGVRRARREQAGDPRIIAWLRAHFHDCDVDPIALGRVALNEPTAVRGWLYGRNIVQVAKMEAVLNTLGFRLDIVPMEDDR